MRFLRILFLVLLASLFVYGQDTETTVIGGKHIGSQVSNRPLMMRGLKLYKDATIRFRTDTTYIYSSGDDTLTIDAGLVIFTGGIEAQALADTNVFTTTATNDTVVVPGTTTSSMFLVSGSGLTVDQQDVLQWTAKADTLIVTRLAAGASGLKYSWWRVKR